MLPWNEQESFTGLLSFIDIPHRRALTKKASLFSWKGCFYIFMQKRLISILLFISDAGRNEYKSSLVIRIGIAHHGNCLLLFYRKERRASIISEGKR